MIRAKRSPLAALLLLAGASVTSAQVELNSAAAPAFNGGSVSCSAVNVGDQTLDIELELIDVATGAIDLDESCTDADAVPPSRRCATGPLSDGGAVHFCRVRVDLLGGSQTPNPTLELVRKWVRATIASVSSNGGTVVVLPVE